MWNASSTLLLPDTVMRHRRTIFYRRNINTRRPERPDGRFPSRSRPLDPRFDTFHAESHDFPRRSRSRLLRCERRALARPLVSELARAAPGNNRAITVRDGYERIIEGRFDMGDAETVHLLELLLL